MSQNEVSNGGRLTQSNLVTFLLKSTDIDVNMGEIYGEMNITL